MIPYNRYIEIQWSRTFMSNTGDAAGRVWNELPADIISAL